MTTGWPTADRGGIERLRTDGGVRVRDARPAAMAHVSHRLSVPPPHFPISPSPCLSVSLSLSLFLSVSLNRPTLPPTHPPPYIYRYKLWPDDEDDRAVCVAAQRLDTAFTAIFTFELLVNMFAHWFIMVVRTSAAHTHHARNASSARTPRRAAGLARKCTSARALARSPLVAPFHLCSFVYTAIPQ
jgi:hypothetical protein